MRRFILLGMAVAALAVTAVALSASGDQGRRLAGPFCISLKSGVVRSIPAVQPCQAGEVRKVGLAVPDTDTDVDPAPIPGPAGANGSAGPPGPAGAPGAAGVVTVTQLTGDQANCVQITGSDGSSGVICGFKKKSKPTCGASGPEYGGIKGDSGDEGCGKD